MGIIRKSFVVNEDRGKLILEFGWQGNDGGYVYFDTVDGTAKIGGDFTAIPRKVFIPAGITDVYRLEANLINDYVAEGPQEFVVVSYNEGRGSDYVEYRYTVRITDDDTGVQLPDGRVVGPAKPDDHAAITRFAKDALNYSADALLAASDLKLRLDAPSWEIKNAKYGMLESLGGPDLVAERLNFKALGLPVLSTLGHIKTAYEALEGASATLHDPKSSAGDAAFDAAARFAIGLASGYVGSVVGTGAATLFMASTLSVGAPALVGVAIGIVVSNVVEAQVESLSIRLAQENGLLKNGTMNAFDSEASDADLPEFKSLITHEINFGEAAPEPVWQYNPVTHEFRWLKEVDPQELRLIASRLGLETEAPVGMDLVGDLDLQDAADVLYGGSGDDSIRAGRADDVILAQSGNDYVTGDEGRDAADGGAGDDRLLGGLGGDQLIGDSGDDLLWGDDGDDELRGGEGDDFLSGDGGNDVLLGGAGDDLIDTGPGDDRAAAGDGNDKIRFGPGAGSMTLVAGDGDDVFEIENETYEAPLSYYVNGDGGFDTLSMRYGYAGLTIVTDIDEDTLVGSAVVSIEQVIGSDFDDTLDIGRYSPTATYALGSGNDTIVGGAGRDVVKGEAGQDRLRGEGGDDRLAGGSGADRLEGGDGDDILRGGNRSDWLFGDMTGSSGQDSLYGNAGNDLIAGGGAADNLSGGAGSDTFWFFDIAELGPWDAADRITDFSALNGDVINLTSIDANSRRAGDQKFKLGDNDEGFSGRVGEVLITRRAILFDLEGDESADARLWVNRAEADSVLL